jgi:esterase/lipase
MKHLLLLHGAIGAKDQFGPLAEKLNDSFTVHTLNFSGHGGLPIPENFSVSLFAGDVLNYLSENNIGTIDIFGYSMGGYVALYLARHHPEKVGRIFTLATKFSWTPEIAARESGMLDPEKITEKIPAFANQLEQRHQPADWRAVLSKTAAMMIAMGAWNPLRMVDFIHIPHQTMMGIGDKDAMVTLEETIAVYRELSQANLIVLPATQHPLEKVDIDRLAAEVKGFFA